MNEDVVTGEFGFAELQRMLSQLQELFWDPTSNLAAALLLYGIVGLLLLIIITIVVMAVLAAPEEEEQVAPAKTPAPGTVQQTPAAPVEEVGGSLLTAVIVVGVIALLWVSVGYSTAQVVVCTGCHVNPPHSATEVVTVDDPHVDTACVGCHEPGGPFARYVVNVPFRAVHFADGLVEASLQPGYGRPTESACLTCHNRDIKETTLNEARGLIMSHEEPLAAAASCLDCHQMRDGVVAAHNAGMNPCLKCHDAVVASSECSTCHDRKATAAARARTASFASAQVEQVQCGGCHDERRECDPCHGVRMPHDEEFMLYAHARAATVDFWFGDGTTCTRSSCHTPTRRRCTKCHGSLLGRGHGPALAGPHEGGSSARCNTCHQVWAYYPQRDFCRDVCHSEAALRYSPR